MHTRTLFPSMGLHLSAHGCSLPSIRSHRKVASPTWISTCITNLVDRAPVAKVNCWAQALYYTKCKTGFFTFRLGGLAAAEGTGRGCVHVLDLSLPMGLCTGVACITLAFVEEGGAPISLAVWPPSSPGPPDPLQEEEFEQLTQVIRCPNMLDSSSGKTACWGGVFCEDKSGD